MKLSEYSDAQLTKELEARQKAFFFKPKRLISPDFLLLMKLIDDVMADSTANHKPNRELIFEAAISAAYGADGLNWYRLKHGNAVKSFGRKLFNV